MAELPRWAGRASLPSLCPSKLAACCPSQLPRKGNECLAPPGFTPLEQMVQHPWVLGREEEATLAMAELIFRPQKSDAHFCPYKCRKLSRFPDPCLPGRSGSWRAQEQRRRVCSWDSMSLGENSREVRVASLRVPGRKRGIVQPRLPHLAGILRVGSSRPFSRQCPSWP